MVCGMGFDERLGEPPAGFYRSNECTLAEANLHTSARTHISNCEAQYLFGFSLKRYAQRGDQKILAASRFHRDCRELEASLATLMLGRHDGRI